MLVYTDADSRVVLLTNDINLRNKGIIMNIDCYSEIVSYYLSNVSDWPLSNDYCERMLLVNRGYVYVYDDICLRLFNC